ncbi:hypothetical protein [Paractinoplanes brasiliensis]|uniref:hypothetical protein n=1 Tax=Paractinoplanes brasiliensis TaxID=52695 RepID=UPI001FB7A94A|nr:hypothetical protein [Actinoplanes brasiliensis]
MATPEPRPGPTQQADGRLTTVAGHAVELIGQPIRFDPGPIGTSKDPSALDPRRAGRKPRLLLPKAVTPQDGDRIGIQRHDAASRVALRFGFLDVPTVVDELDRHHQLAPLQIHVFPAKATRLSSTQTPQRDEMEKGVKLVTGDIVEEPAGLVRGPHHHWGRPFSGGPVARDSLIGPYDRLGPTDRVEFYMRGRVEGDQLLRDGVVKRSPQRRPDMQSRPWPSGTAKRRHGLQSLSEAIPGIPPAGNLEF